MAGTINIPELESWDDAFGNQVSARTNVLDIAAHYPYNPERWTLSVDGSRVFPEYGAVSQYNHAGDYHELQPAAGETVTLESAERPRYVVQYELAATWAFAVNQSLASGDSIRVGLYDGSNGWYMEHTGDHPDDSTGDFVLERDGSAVYRREDVDLAKDVLSNRRLKLQTGWYDITRQRWERSYSDSGTQKNDLLISTSADTERGSKTGNLPIHFSVTASGSTSNLVLEAGSAAQVNLGATVGLQRFKVAVHTDNIGTTGSWVPLRAYRIDPAREIINVQLRDVDIGEYSVSENVELLIQSFDTSNVADSGGNALEDSDFSTPPEFNGRNNVLETTANAAQFADSAGTLTTSASDPGGWQLGRGELYSGGGNNISGSTSSPENTKRPIYERDYILVLGKSPSTGDVTYQLEFEQDW